MKRIRILMSLLSIIFGLKYSDLANAQISIKQTSPTKIQLGWNSIPEDLYTLLSSTNMLSWHVVSSAFALSEKTQLERKISDESGSREFYSLVQTPVVGLTLIPTNSVLSGQVVIPFQEYSLTNSNPQMLILEDVSNEETNILDYVVKVSPATNFLRRYFTFHSEWLDSRSNHILRARVLDDRGSWDRSDSLRERVGNPYPCTISNDISLLDFKGSIGWKLHLVILTKYSVGTWSVFATNDLNQSIGFWSGNFNFNTNSKREIICEDTNAVPEGYPGSKMKINVGVNSPGLPTLSYLTVADIDKRPKLTGTLNEATLGFVVGVDPYHENDWDEIDVLQNIADRFYFDLNASCFDLSLGQWVDQNNYGVMGWDILRNLFGENYFMVPTHVHLYSRGGPGYLGSPIVSSDRISGNDLSTNSPHIKPTFLFLDGHSFSFGTLFTLIDTSRWGREQIYKGKFPRYGCGFVSNSMVGSDDHRLFVNRFYEKFLEKDWFSGVFINTAQVARIYASTRIDGSLNPIAKYFFWTGCEDIWVDEVLPILDPFGQ